MTIKFKCTYGGNCRKLCTNSKCEKCHNMSFASSDKAKYWLPENNVTPRKVFKGTLVKYSFKCGKCKHIFEQNLNNILKGCWCSYCTNQKLCDDENCQTCFEKSFASVDESKFWSKKKNKNITPRDVFKGSKKKFIFYCLVCKHNFEISLANILRGRWCAYCSKTTGKLCSDINCEFCFNKSFASHKKAFYWAEENNLDPRNVRKYTRKKFIFNCSSCNNKYIASLCNVSNGNWCNCKINKTAGKLFEWLKNKYNVQKEVRLKWCKNPETNNYLPFDFLIEEYKIIIELDGLQHFKQAKNWQSPKEIQKRDVYKMKMAFKKGYTIIRILQDDVWKDKNNWEKCLTQKIKAYDTEKCIYIDNVKQYYLSHKELMEK